MGEITRLVRRLDERLLCAQWLTKGRSSRSPRPQAAPLSRDRSRLGAHLWPVEARLGRRPHAPRHPARKPHSPR